MYLNKTSCIECHNRCVRCVTHCEWTWAYLVLSNILSTVLRLISDIPKTWRLRANLYCARYCVLQICHIRQSYTVIPYKLAVSPPQTEAQSPPTQQGHIPCGLTRAKELRLLLSVKRTSAGFKAHGLAPADLPPWFVNPPPLPPPSSSARPERYSPLLSDSLSVRLPMAAQSLSFSLSWSFTCAERKSTHSMGIQTTPNGSKAVLYGGIWKEHPTCFSSIWILTSWQLTVSRSWKSIKA